MTLLFHEPEYHGLRKVISGGQCGSDFGALSAAWLQRVETGGHAPQGWRTHFGPKPQLGSIYGLAEDSSYKYPPRTQKNVVNSDGTLIIASNPGSPGCSLTSKLARGHEKPQLIIRTPDLTGLLENNFEIQGLKVAIWIIRHRIEVLNVAGNRDKVGTFHHDAAVAILTWAFLNLESKGLLVVRALQ